LPRKAREKSRTGIYHVIFRGINRQQIFEEEADYQKFLYVLQDQRNKGRYEVYAYCLMGNHIHLLIKEGDEDLGVSFRRIASNYVLWYNRKYERVGHLFQDRYKSEVVEDQRYFLQLIRYIHQNPVKAGMVQEISKYPWSSYQEYFSEAKVKICNSEVAFYCLADRSDDVIKYSEDPDEEHTKQDNVQGNHEKKEKDQNKDKAEEKDLAHSQEKVLGKEQKRIVDQQKGLTEEQREGAKIFFREFHKVRDHKPYMEYDRNRRWQDEDAARFVQHLVHGKSPKEIQTYESEQRNEVIIDCKKQGISLRQLERITGISLSILRRI